MINTNTTSNKMKASHPISAHHDKCTYSKKDHEDLVHLARNLRRVKRQLFLQHIEDSKPVQVDPKVDVLAHESLTVKDSKESVTTTNSRRVHTAVQPTD